MAVASIAAVSAPARPAASPWLITVPVMRGMIMAIIDGPIVTVGLNTMAGNLGASIDDAAWIVPG